LQTYLVGGAVRDNLLNISNNDNDWVVVGSTADEMISLGFQAVGKDFPVYLHAKTKEEYALARTERKSGHGYTGFNCHFSPDVSLEEDLIRRDLTINAMACDQSGAIIDPYGGQNDLKERILRHVSPAFVDDPLRVLRVARFAAKLAPLGFTIAPETVQLMSSIVDSGELEHLTPERIWQEWHKSLITDRPDIFLSALRECNALQVILPEIDRLFGVPQSEKWHPEIDTGVHTLMVAKQAAMLTTSDVIRFSAQVHDLGKGMTPRSEWPSHKKHEHTGLAIINTLCARVKVPNNYKELALAVCAQHSNVHRAHELKPSTFLKMFNQLDVWRKPEKLDQLLIACISDHKGRKGHEDSLYPQKSIFEAAFKAAISINVQDVINDGFKGHHIRDELDRRRTQAIKNR